MEVVRNETEVIDAHAWGRKDYRDELLRIIAEKQDALPVEDCAGHIYWNQFKELVESIKP